MEEINKGPPRGIISNAWVNKTCPCRDGDDCVPRPYHLKNIKMEGKKRRYLIYFKILIIHY